MSAIRRADVTWDGDLTSGEGVVSAGTSRLFTRLPVSWGSRSGEAGDHTSPEELMAAAHASCFAMALSAGLAKAGMPPRKLEVSATVTFDNVDGAWQVVSSALKVRGEVPGIDDEEFRRAAEAAKDTCPVSQALRSNIMLMVEASLWK